MKNLLFVLVLLNSAICFAQVDVGPTIVAADSGGSTGTGGSGEESQLIVDEVMIKESLLRIKRFFDENASKERVKSDFPEINPNELANKIDDALLKAKFIYDDVVKDFAGIERYAVNYEATGIIEYDMNKMKSISSPAAFYVLQFHEILGLMGLEKNDPENELLIDSYPIASKLAKYVVKVLSYGLSADVEDQDNMGKLDFVCRVKHSENEIAWLSVKRVNVDRSIEMTHPEHGLTQHFSFPYGEISFAMNPIITKKTVVDPITKREFIRTNLVSSSPLFFELGSIHKSIDASSPVGIVVYKSKKTLSRVIISSGFYVSTSEGVTMRKWFDVIFESELDQEAGTGGVTYQCTIPLWLAN